MAGEYEELLASLNELITNRFAPKPTFTRGLLGDGLGNVSVPNRPDKSYVRFNRGSTEFFEVFNVTVNAVNDWPVLIGELPWLPGLTQVVGTDWAAYEQSGWDDNVGATSPHAPTHEWPDGSPGSDALNIYMRAIVPLRGYTLGTGSTTIYVNSYEYENPNGTGTVWGGLPGIDLATVMSATSTGTARFMGIYLDPNTNTLGIVTGATDIFTDASDPPLPQYPRGILPAARVRVYGGQTSIGEIDIRDARQPFGFIPTGTSAIDANTGENHNLLYQSLTHDIWQDETTFANFADDTYVADLWNGLHSATGTFPTATRQAGGSNDPFSHYLRLVANESSTQMGIVQFIEAQDTYPLRDQVVSLSFDAWGTGITHVRAAVLSWGSTADVITSDVVSTWLSGGYPVLATNWNYANLPIVATAIDGTRTRYTFENITIPSTANNLAVFIWTPNLETTTDLLNIARVRLELGDTATAFVPLGITQEHLKIARFYFNPNWNDPTATRIWTDAAFRITTNRLDLRYDHPVVMRIPPTASMSGFDTTGLGVASDDLGGFNYVSGANITSVGTISISSTHAQLRQTTFRIQAATSILGSQGDACFGWAGVDVKVELDARL